MDGITKEKWQEMDFSKKVQWLIQYYGLAAVIVIVVLIFAVSFLKTVLFPEKVCLEMIVLDDGLGTEQQEALNAEIKELLSDAEGKAEVTFFYKGDAVQQQAFTVRVAAGGLDLVIVPEKELQWMDESGYFTEEPAEVPKESRYGKIRVGTGEKVYIGIPADSKNAENGKKVMEYLMGESENGG